jgi:hypothetical protein
LNDLANLALAGGYRSAARTAYEQLAQMHAGHPLPHVNLGNLHLSDGDLPAADACYRAALAQQPDFAPAHQGLAKVLSQLEDPDAERHGRLGFAGQAVTSEPYRGPGTAPSVLLLVSTRGGNIPIASWINDRSFSVHALHVDFHDASNPLPAHDVVVNAIGDADLCGAALEKARTIIAHSPAPVINAPERIRVTGRAENARRMSGVDGLVVPRIVETSAFELRAGSHPAYPFLLRRPGLHTGQDFHFVTGADDLRTLLDAATHTRFLKIDYVDSRGGDGLSRKFRVLFIDGETYPVHLAASKSWKVHYFTAAMGDEPGLRDEEARFLNDHRAFLGDRAVAALASVATRLGLDYAGMDFGLQADGSLIFYEANATMVLQAPGPEAMWDYRRAALDTAIAAARRMVARRASGP